MYIFLRLQHQSHCLKSSIIDSNYRHPPNMQTPNTSTKQTHFHQTHPVRFEGDTTAMATTNLASFSNSDSHLCDQFVHDINCAKNKYSYLNQANNGQPDI